LAFTATVAAQNGFSIKDSGLTVDVAATVPLGGKVLLGGGAQLSAGSGSFAVYYTGFEKDRSVVHLRTKWSWGASGVAPILAQGDQELTLFLGAEAPTRVVLALAPSRPGSDNAPTIELEIQGVDEFQQLVVTGAANFMAKSDKK
jgi:hypothetical protein